MMSQDRSELKDNGKNYNPASIHQHIIRQWGVQWGFLDDYCEIAISQDLSAFTNGSTIIYISIVD